MVDFYKKENGIKAARIGIIVAAHVVVLAVIYLISGFGDTGSEREGLATAGANGIVNWSSDSPNAQAPTVTIASIDSRAADLSGYNAEEGGGSVRAAVPEISSRERFSPRRPNGGQAQKGGIRSAPTRGTLAPSINNDESVLTPLGGPSVPNIQPSSIIAPVQASDIIRYTIRSGDSLWAISKKFGISRDELHSVNPGLTVNIQAGQVINVPRSTSAPPEVPPAGSYSVSTLATTQGNVYTVKSGDVLSRIAANQGVTLSELRSANQLSGDLIRVGQKLVIPRPGGARSYPALQSRGQGLQVVVATGDSIFSIAERYNVAARDIVLSNNIQDPALINPGQTLLIPSQSSQSARQPNPATIPSQSTPRTALSKPSPPPETIPEDPPLRLLDEEDFLQDEELIEQIVIPIEN